MHVYMSLILISRPISRKSCHFFIWIGLLYTKTTPTVEGFTHEDHTHVLPFHQDHTQRGTGV
jgi:hypothetical protein